MCALERYFRISISVDKPDREIELERDTELQKSVPLFMRYSELYKELRPDFWRFGSLFEPQEAHLEPLESNFHGF